MFCPECGTQNADDSVFCEECGTSIIEDKDSVGTVSSNEKVLYVQPVPPIQQTPAIPRQPFSKKKLIIMGEIILLVVILIGWYSIAKKVTAPSEVVKDYFEAVTNADWEKVYDASEFPESSFLSKEQFLKIYSDRQSQVITNFKVDSKSNMLEDSGELIKTYSVEYRLKGNSELNYYDVGLLKQAEKDLLFFPKWEVNPQSFIATNFTLAIPKGAMVSVDGITLKDEYIEGDYYRIPQLFLGTHEIKIELDNFEDYETTYEVIQDDMEFYCDKMKLKESISMELLEKSGETLEKIYEAAIWEKSFNTINNIFASDSEVQYDMKERYEDLLYRITWNSENVSINDLSVSNINARLMDYDMNGLVVVELNYDYKFTITELGYKTIYSDIPDETREVLGSNESDFTYVFQKGEWVLESVNFDSFYPYY